MDAESSEQTIATASEEAADPRLMSPYACNLAQDLTLGRGVCQARKVEAAHRRIGELISRGQCDRATTAARDTGDLGFADRVQAACLARSH